MMTERAKEAMRAYKRQWYQQNRERVRTYNTRYWEKKAAELAGEKQNEQTKRD